MKKHRALALAAVATCLLVFVIYKMGDRRITIFVDGAPAAGRQLQKIVNSDVFTLDTAGSAELPWGLKEHDPHVWFKSAPDRNWTLSLPNRGSRTYRISGSDVVTENVYLDLGVFKIQGRVTQTTLSEEELQNLRSQD